MNLIWILVTLGTFHFCYSEELSNGVSFLDSDGSISRCFLPEAISNSSSTSTISNVEEVSKIMLDGSKHFALQLFRTLNMFEPKETSKGIIFSPTSIWSTLLLTYLGSRGETELELRSKLKLQNLSKKSVALAYKTIKLWKNLKMANSSSVVVSSANKLFVADHLKIRNCFASIFSDEIESLSFRTNSSQCLSYINSWVSQQTHGKILKLLSPGSVTGQTQVIMVNAIYLKSFWAQQFDPSKTKKMTFHVSVTEEIETDMMSIDSLSLMYGVSEELMATAVELPYSNPDYSMLILLPDESRGLDSLIRDLSLVKFQNLLSMMYDDEVMLMLPKFRAEQEFELAGTLFSLGIKKLFDPRYVNLTEIFANDLSKQVALDSVIHKSFIQVNEEGTEAAAATAMIFARSGRPAFPTQFIANRPFLYMIREASTNMILFLGSVRRPSTL